MEKKITEKAQVSIPYKRYDRHCHERCNSQDKNTNLQNNNLSKKINTLKNAIEKKADLKLICKMIDKKAGIIPF